MRRVFQNNLETPSLCMQEWVRCKALRMRPTYATNVCGQDRTPIATLQIARYGTPSSIIKNFVTFAAKIRFVMEFFVSEIKIGAPSEYVNDLQRLIFETLAARGIDYTRVDSDPGITMDDCLNIDRAFGVDTVKTILLTNRQKNKFWLYVSHARRPFVTRDFGAALQIPRVSFADEQLMLEILGTQHGAATPFGLLRPQASEVTFVMDKDVADRDQIVITDGEPCGFVCISLNDLFALVGTPIII